MKSNRSGAPARYSHNMIIMHWMVTIVAILHLVNAMTLSWLQDMQMSLAVMALHRSFGVVLFVMMAVRLVFRFRDPVPSIKEGIPVWQAFTARAVHYSLYAILFIAPVVGWVYTNSVGMSVTLFWLVPLPALTGPSLELAANLLPLHKLLAFALVSLLAMHIGATLFNKYFMNNNVMAKITFEPKCYLFKSYFSIWLKQGLSAAGVMVFCFIISWTAISSSQQMSKVSLDLYQNYFQAINTLHSAQGSWKSVLENMVPDKPGGAFDASELSVSLAQFKDHLASVLEKDLTQDRRDKITQMSGLASQLEPLVKAGAFDLQLIQSAQTLPTNIDSLIQDMIEASEEATTNLEDIGYRTSDKIILILTFVLLISAVMMAASAGSISMQVKRAIKFSELIASGELAQGVEVKGHTEMAQLMRQMDVMRNGLKIQFEDLTEMQKIKAFEQERADAKLEELQKTIAEFEHDAKGIISSVNTRAIELEETSKEISLAADSSLESVISTSQSTERTLENSQLALASVDGTLSAILTLADQARESKSLSVTTTDLAQTASTSMDELDEVSGNIDSIVSLITDIAEQTNLLALNATIEAARAGDAGKGFSVVASEVKNLANRTGQATDQISRMVQALKSTTKSTSGVLHELTGAVDNMSRFSENISEELNINAQSAQEAAANLTSVTNEMEAIAQNIENVQLKTKNTRSSSILIANSSLLLTEASKDISIKIKCFIDRLKAA